MTGIIATVTNNNSSPLPSGNDIRLPWHLRLPAPLEKQFRHYLLESVIRIAPWAFGLVMALNIAAMICEFLVNPAYLATSWRARLLIIFAASGCFLLARHPQWRHWLHPATLLLALTIAMVGNYLGIRVDDPLSYAFFLHTSLAILLISALIRTPFHTSLMATLMLAALMTLSAYHSQSTSHIETLILTVLTGAYASISLLGQYIYERLLRQHFLAENVLYQHRDELHSANQILENQATVDGLTGCINRRGMESRLASLYHQLRQTPPGQDPRITLLLFDIDFFKQYNDTYGHPAGDECLKTVANVPLSMVQSDTDFVARYGGEEFVILYPQTGPEALEVMARQILESIRELEVPHSQSPISTVVTASIGLATLVPEASKQPEDLVRAADHAVYMAKRKGRNRLWRDEQGASA